MDNLHGSDHYRIKITPRNNPSHFETTVRFKTNKADWTLFEALTCTSFDSNGIDNVDTLTDEVESILLAAAEASIPKSSGKFTRPPVLWWNYVCHKARTDRIRAERALKRVYIYIYIHSIEKKIHIIEQKLDVNIFLASQNEVHGRIMSLQ